MKEPFKDSDHGMEKKDGVDPVLMVIASAISPRLWSQEESSLTTIQTKDLRKKSLDKALSVVNAIGLREVVDEEGTKYVAESLPSLINKETIISNEPTWETIAKSLEPGGASLKENLKDPKEEALLLLSEISSDSGNLIPVNIDAVCKARRLYMGKFEKMWEGEDEREGERECAHIVFNSSKFRFELIRNPLTRIDPKLLIAYAVGRHISDRQPCAIIHEKEFERPRPRPRSWAYVFAMEVLMPTVPLIEVWEGSGGDINKVCSTFAVSKELANKRLLMEGEVGDAR